MIQMIQIPSKKIQIIIQMTRKTPMSMQVIQLLMEVMCKTERPNEVLNDNIYKN
jgi:hypothetical protein